MLLPPSDAIPLPLGSTSPGSLHGLLYAPTSNVNVTGTIYGSVVGSNVTLNSGGAVHFDLGSTCDGSPGAVVDQSLTIPGGVSAGVYGPGSWMAQTYTAGITGTLQGAAVSLTASNPDFLARIQVRTVVDGEPSETILGEGFAATTGDLSIDTVTEFTSEIPHVAGEQYALLVNCLDAPPFVDNMPSLADWIGAMYNPHAGGVTTYSNDSGATWTVVEESDLLFQTFVVPD